MIRCLIKNNAFTLTELMIAVAITVLLMLGVYGFYSASSQSYSAGVTGQTLQDAANIVLNRVIEGETESGTVYRLATAVSYMIPNGTPNNLYTCGGAPQSIPCNASGPFSEIYYCQDTPCTNTDITARWYYLNAAGTSVIYHHPAAGGGTIEETIYTAPTDTSFFNPGTNSATLRFSPAAVGVPANVVEIDVALTKNLAEGVTNSRLAASGSESTFVLLRNHP